MDTKQYQDWVRRMWNWQDPNETVKRFTKRCDTIMGLGLGGEAGEVLEILKKHVRSREKNIDKEHLTEELGDVLYMVSIIASRYGIKLDEIIDYNVNKLEARKAKRINKSRKHRK